MNTINALTAVKPVSSATGDAEGRQQFQQQSRPGQTFTATVLEPVGDNRYYLDILNNKILAQSDEVTLSTGTKLNLEVLSTAPLLELKIISKSPEMFFGKTLTLLGKNLDITGLFQALLKPEDSSLLKQLSPSSQEGLRDFYNLQQTPTGSLDFGNILKQLINRQGLSLEALLADGKQNQAVLSLKAALLEIASTMKQGIELADSANRLLGTLELYQLAQLRLTSENLLIFPLPLPFLENGYLLVERDNSESTSPELNKPLRFSLHLSLEPLGDMEIIFLHTEEGLYIRFGCDSIEKKEFIADHKQDLNEIITTADVLGVTVTETAKNPTNDLIQQLVPHGESILDTTI